MKKLLCALLFLATTAMAQVSSVTIDANGNVINGKTVNFASGKLTVNGVQITGVDASSTVKGITKLSVDPVSPTNPIAVGDNDSRNTNARTPTAHAASHASGGTDPVTLIIAQITGLQSALDLKAPLASPTFTGVPLAPTAAVDTNTTQIATTGFVLAQAANATPIVASTGAVGTSTRYARQDHVHPAQTSVTGNAGTATALATARTLSITGDLGWTSPSFDGTGNVTAVGTLATVNSNVGTFGDSTHYATVTVNGKGLVTAASQTAWPTFNQSTTGSAATLTTPRAIYGNNFDGSVALSQIIASTYGGTGNGFTKFSGPATSEKTKTLSNASDTILELGGSYTPTGTWTSLTLVTPALGTPASGVVTNLTGTASININGTVGATTPAAGTFTTGVFGSTTSLLLGTSGSAVGNIGFRNATSGTATLAPPTGALGTYNVTLPNAASTLPIFGQQITFSGPSAARTVTFPDASFTAARTDAANTFTGASTGTSWTLTTPVLASGLTASGSGANDFSGSTGTFLTSSGTNTLNGTVTITPPVRTSGTAAYLTLNIPADTAQTAATESIGFKTVTATRQWATTGTVALQRENFFAGPTYSSASASQTFTDAFTLYATPPVAGTNAIFTRGHTLGIVDSTSAASSITGALVIANTLGTSATSVGIGAGNINAGGNGTFGGTLSVTGHTTLEGVTSTGATGTGKLVYDGSPSIGSPTFTGTVAGTPTWGSNQAITLSTAAQPNVTSLGTVTSLTSSGAISNTQGSSGSVGMTTINTSSAGISRFEAGNDVSNYLDVGVVGSTYTPYGAVASGDAYQYSPTSITMMADGSGKLIKFAAGGNAEKMRIDVNRVSMSAPFRLKGYTVSTLPAGTTGDEAYVTDALAPAFGATLVGGGAVTTKAFYNGSNWIAE